MSQIFAMLIGVIGYYLVTDSMMTRWEKVSWAIAKFETDPEKHLVIECAESIIRGEGK